VVVMFVTCPVCGANTQAPGESVYRNEWDHTTNPPTCRVLKQQGHRCGECTRLYTTEHGTEIDADLISAMQNRATAARGIQ
jgi:hypothetical protein